MSDFPLVSLKDCCKVIGGATPKRDVPEYWGNDVPWVTPKDVSSLESPILDDAPEYISKAGYKNCSTYLLPKGSILLTSRAPIGNVAIAGMDMCTNQGFKSLVPGKDVDSTYLYYCIKSLSPRLQAMGNGATFKEVSKRIVENFEIPLPPLKEQKRIAVILDKADAIRRKRQQAIDLTDQLIRSVFLDMFGDPVTNPNKFQIRCLKEFYINSKDGTKCGPFGSALKKHEYVSSGVPVWNMDNISKGSKFSPPAKLWIDEQKYRQLETYNTINGDIIISRAGTVGKMCVLKSDYKHSIISTNLIRLRLNKNLSPIYFVSLMNYCKGRVGRLKTGPDGTFTHMNTGVLDKLNFPYPPIELQNKYEQIFERFNSELRKQSDGLGLIDVLFYSLSQQAFSGELSKQTEAA